MGINDEYSRDAYNYDLAYDSDGSDEVDNDLHPEDWQDLYSQELLDGWMVMKQYLDERYIEIHGSFHDFVNLVLEPSAWYMRGNPDQIWSDIWRLIGNLPIISERVQAPSFYAWAEKYIGYS